MKVLRKYLQTIAAQIRTIITAVGARHSCGRRNPGVLVKTGTDFLMFLVPCFRRDDVWIPLPTGRQAFSRLRAEALRRASTGMTP